MSSAVASLHRCPQWISSKRCVASAKAGKEGTANSAILVNVVEKVAATAIRAVPGKGVAAANAALVKLAQVSAAQDLETQKVQAMVAAQVQVVGAEVQMAQEARLPGTARPMVSALAAHPLKVRGQPVRRTISLVLNQAKMLSLAGERIYRNSRTRHPEAIRVGEGGRPRS